MTATRGSQQTVFRYIAQHLRHNWPTYDSTPLYDRSSLSAVEEDIQTVASVWFKHNAHDSVTDFVCRLPLAYFEFEPHDRYTESTSYEMDTLFRVFVLKELHEWDHETVLVEFLDVIPDFTSNSDLIAFRLSRRSGAVGTSASQLNCVRQSRQPPGQSS